MNKIQKGGLFALLMVWLTGAEAQAFYDDFESYTNGTTFVVATNGWQASTNGVQVQTNTVYDGTNAVIVPQVSTLTNIVASDLYGTSFVWLDCRVLPSLGTLPASGDMTNSSDSVRLCFVKTSDTTGYTAVESNRNNWVICSNNVAGSAAATQISSQWVRVSILADYGRSNAAVFVDGELLRAFLPLPGTVATNYNRALWDVQISTNYLDTVSITTNWPAFPTNSLTDLDNDGLLDAQELQIYGNLTTYHRPNIHLVTTNLTLGGTGGGTTVPVADFTLMPYTGTNFAFHADPGYHVYDTLTNGTSVGVALLGRYTGLATYTNNSISTDTTVTVEYRSNYVVTASAGTGGSITPSLSVVYPGSNLVFAITSFPAYVVAAITNNGVADVSCAGRKIVSYTNNVQANTSLQVTFSYTSNRTVGASGDYPTINEATAAALAGDTIQVSDGIYSLTAPVVITNRITLLGNTNSPGSVQVVAPTSGTDMDCFQVRTNGVTIEGFLMAGATNGTGGAGSGYLNAGIMVGNDTASNQMAAVRVLTNLGSGLFLFNQFSNCTHGVYVMAATNCVVSQSAFLGNTTGVWASVSTEARSNWWGDATGPGPVGPGGGDKISSNVVYMKWWSDAGFSVLWPQIHVVTTNLTLGTLGGGVSAPSTNADFLSLGTNFTATAAAGYYVWDVLTNGSSVGLALAGQGTGQAMYTNNAFSGDTTVTIQFKTNPIVRVVSTNLTLNVAGGGTVAPTTNVNVMVYPAIGTNFTMTANSGYHVYDVLTNGSSVGAALSGQFTGLATYTNSSLWTDTTVTVQFRSNYLVTASAGTGGSITPLSSVVYPGTNLVFAITSSPAYVVATITNNGTPNIIYAGQKIVSYPLNAIQANTSLQVTFSYTSNRTVGVSGDYPTISAAVAAALAGDTIQVADGTYALTTPVVITNRITLLGNTNSPASVWVQAPTSGADLDCFQVRTNGVAIEGFLMTGATNGTGGAGSGYLNAGIIVGNDAASNQMAAVRVLTNLGSGTFLFNQFSNCSHGVYVMAATNCVVSQSAFLGNTTGVWASVSTEARSNWWGDATGPGPVGPGLGDKVSSNVVTMPWWFDAERSARVIYTNAPGLQPALDLAGAGDVIWTTNGPYAGDIVIARTVRFLTGFSLDGMITFSTNVTLAAAYACTNATVASGVTVSIITGGALTATNLVIQGTGLVVGSGGTAQLTADGYTVNGAFSADSTWATLVPSTLDLSDDFERYVLGTKLSALGIHGWSATDDGVVVQTNTAASGTNAVILPPYCEIDNNVTTLATRIWTDLRVLPVPGDLSSVAATSNQSIRVSFGSNGWLAVDTTNGWQICSNDVLGGVAPKVSNQWVRFSMFQDYQAGRQAVFLDGVLLRQQLAFVGGNASVCSKLRYLNTGTESNAFMDAVFIGTNLPSGLTGDLNGDGTNDAVEISQQGFLNPRPPQGSIFKIR